MNKPGMQAPGERMSIREHVIDPLRSSSRQSITPHRQLEPQPFLIGVVEPSGTSRVGSLRHLNCPQHWPGAVREVEPSCQ